MMLVRRAITLALHRAGLDATAYGRRISVKRGRLLRVVAEVRLDIRRNEGFVFTVVGDRFWEDPVTGPTVDLVKLVVGKIVQALMEKAYAPGHP